eukprot:1160459-Pelagomonas_calceolata.AAC.6
MTHLFRTSKSAPVPHPTAPDAAGTGGNAHAGDEGSAMEVVVDGVGGASESAAAAAPGGCGGEAGADGIEVVRNVVVLTNDNGMCILVGGRKPLELDVHMRVS